MTFELAFDLQVLRHARLYGRNGACKLLEASHIITLSYSFPLDRMRTEIYA